MTESRFKISLPEPPNGMTQMEWQCRLDLTACYRLVDYYGWTSVVYNHITCRIPDTNHFLINPFGMRYDEIRATDLIKVDVDGEKVSHSKWPVNRAGYLIHSAIHKARPDDLHCVIHTHEAVSQALCALDSPVVPVTQEGCQFYQRVGYHDFGGIVLDGSEEEKICAALGDHNHTLVLRNHGLITAGPSCAWAFTRHYAFTRNASVQLQAMAAGNINLIDDEVMIRTREQFEGGDAQAGAKVRHPEWPALVRLIDSMDPTWKL